MKGLLAWLDEAKDFYTSGAFHRAERERVRLEPLPMSPEAEKAVQDALAGIKADEWIDSMMKVTLMHPPPTSWATASAEQIMADIKKYAALARPRLYNMEAEAKVIPLREAYAEQLLRDSLNSTPFKITNLSGF